MKVDTKNYIYAFHAEGNDYLITDFFIRNYIDLEPLILSVPGEWAVYLPQQIVKQTLQEGLRLASDLEALKKYQKNFNQYLDKASEFIRKPIVYPINLSAWQEFVAFSSRIWIYYRRTEWFYTDLLYKEEGHKGAKKVLEDLKQRGRETMNNMFFGESPFMKAKQQLAKQLQADITGIDMSNIHEVSEALTVGQLSERRHDRKTGYGVVVGKGEVIELSSQEALNLHDLINPGKEKDAADVILKGVTAMQGKVSGKATVIPALYRDFQKLAGLIDEMPQDNILVATTTSPEIIVAIKKAAAIVTDQGGLGSHAAIVSRELGIPCIVGTRRATQVISNGDEIEVDAEKGIVRILNKKL